MMKYNVLAGTAYAIWSTPEHITNNYHNWYIYLNVQVIGYDMTK